MFRRRKGEPPPNKGEYLHRLVFNITDDLPELQAEARAAAKEFFGGEPLTGSEMEIAQASGRMMEWFVFDRVVKRTGKVPFEMWLEAMGDRLSEEERAVYEGYRDNVYSMFEILEVRRGEGLTLRDHFTEKIYEVREKRGTYQVRKGETLIGRVLPAGDAYELSGVTLRLPHQLTQDLKQVFPQGIDTGERLDPLTVEQILFGRKPPRERRPSRPSRLPPGLNIPADLEEQVAQELEQRTAGQLTLAELRLKIQGTDDFMVFLQWAMDRLVRESDSDRKIERLLDLLLKLWNATPREEFGGKSPAEILREEFPELWEASPAAPGRQRDEPRSIRRKRRR